MVLFLVKSRNKHQYFILVFETFFLVLTGEPASSHLVSQQPAHRKKTKVFVTDGKDEALTGVCVFFTRTNTSKAITSENIHKVSHFSTKCP